jgi:hypothetical protein
MDLYEELLEIVDALDEHATAARGGSASSGP